MPLTPSVAGPPPLGYNFGDAQPAVWVDARFRADSGSLTLRAPAGNREGDGRTVVEWDR
jgi:hypothetical protein